MLRARHTPVTHPHQEHSSSEETYSLRVDPACRTVAHVMHILRCALRAGTSTGQPAARPEDSPMLSNALMSRSLSLAAQVRIIHDLHSLPMR